MPALVEGNSSNIRPADDVPVNICKADAEIELVSMLTTTKSLTLRREQVNAVERNVIAAGGES